MTGPELLLAAARPDRPRRLLSRELTVELALAAAVLCAGATCALLVPSGRPLDLATAAACLAAYAAGARTRLYVGGGSALATQLAFVPMLFLLPLGWVPLAAAAGLTLAALPGVLARRTSAERLVTAVGDAGYALAPVLVLAAAGAPDVPAWGIVLAATGAQCAFDAALSTGREWLGRGIRPSVQLGVMATVYGVDLLLLPVGVALARHPSEVVAALPLTALLWAVARDRNRRLDEALDRLGALERARDRVREAIRRTGRSLGYSLDRQTVLEVAVGTAVDAVGGAAGRARLAGSARAMTFEAVPHEPGAAESAALLAAERAALAGHTGVAEACDGWWAIARPLTSGRRTTGAVAACRATGPFSDDEAELFAYLVAQAAASLETIDLNELLQGGPGRRRHPARLDQCHQGRIR